MPPQSRFVFKHCWPKTSNAPAEQQERESVQQLSSGSVQMAKLVCYPTPTKTSPGDSNFIEHKHPHQHSGSMCFSTTKETGTFRRSYGGDKPASATPWKRRANTSLAASPLRQTDMIKTAGFTKHSQRSQHHVLVVLLRRAGVLLPHKQGKGTRSCDAYNTSRRIRSACKRLSWACVIWHWPSYKCSLPFPKK